MTRRTARRRTRRYARSSAQCWPAPPTRDSPSMSPSPARARRTRSTSGSRPRPGRSTAAPEPRATRMTAGVWLVSGPAAWLGSLVFAAFGLFLGFLAPSENVLQIVGPVLAILALFGGLFVPLQFLPQVMLTIAKYTPVYGVGEMARAPLVGGFHLTGLVNVIAWTVFFAVTAMQLFRRDTARV